MLYEQLLVHNMSDCLRSPDDGRGSLDIEALLNQMKYPTLWIDYHLRKWK